MVKNIKILFVLFCFISFAQKQQNLWWQQTTANLKYETAYKNVLCEISDGILKDQIIEFVKTHISHTNKSKEEIAIEVTSLFSKNKNEKVYRITYVSNYYNELSYKPNIQQIAKLNSKIILIKDRNLEDFKINENILFGMLRDRYKLKARYMRKEYEKLKNNGGGIPVLIVSDHQVPIWNLNIKDGRVTEKNITYD